MPLYKGSYVHVDDATRTCTYPPPVTTSHRDEKMTKLVRLLDLSYFIVIIWGCVTVFGKFFGLFIYLFKFVPACLKFSKSQFFDTIGILFAIIDLVLSIFDF